jgi:hypothetical protein
MNISFKKERKVTDRELPKRTNRFVFHRVNKPSFENTDNLTNFIYFNIVLNSNFIIFNFKIMFVYLLVFFIGCNKSIPQTNYTYLPLQFKNNIQKNINESEDEVINEIIEVQNV